MWTNFTVDEFNVDEFYSGRNVSGPVGLDQFCIGRDGVAESGSGRVVRGRVVL